MAFVGKLLPYQPEAVDKMLERKKLLVSYDLGLGKTVLTIAAIEKLRDDGLVTAPGLIICLATLKGQWADAIAEFSDSSSLIIDGKNASARDAQYERVFNWKETGIQYMITNYELVWRDIVAMKALPRDFIVTDEATALKSFRPKRSKAVKSLSCPIKFALTGTPIENGKPEELFSIMQFVDPTVLGSYQTFDNAFIVRNPWGGVERYRNLPLLHSKMKDASVRKAQTDPDVAPFLPETIHVAPIRVRFDSAGAKLYNLIKDDLLDKLDEIKFDAAFDLGMHYGGGQAYDKSDPIRGQVMSMVTCLRMLCDNPNLLRTSAAKAADIWTMGGSKYAAMAHDLGWLDKAVKTPKLDVLSSYVSDLLDDDPRNKVVIFSTFVDTLGYISDIFGREQCIEYSGKMSHAAKNAAKVAFNKDPKIRLFISSDAGGYGVDLPAANTLINYDLPWSSGLATQRNGRITRASSVWPSIVVQDLLMAGSIEEWQYDKLRQKSAVASAVVDGININNKGGVDMSVQSLSKFLRSNSV